MPRLRRAASQARTRELLVATARDLFLRDGFHATSLDRVADAAGFSKGAVYSNFRSKDELCLAVLDALHAGEVAAIAEAFAGDGAFEARLAAFERWAERRIGDAGWTRLEIEFAVHARRDPALRGQLAARDRAVRETLAALVASQLEAAGRAPVLPPDVLATALLSLGIGLGLQRTVDPELPIRVLTDTFRALVHAGEARAKTQAKKPAKTRTKRRARRA